MNKPKTSDKTPLSEDLMYKFDILENHLDFSNGREIKYGHDSEYNFFINRISDLQKTAMKFGISASRLLVSINEKYGLHWDIIPVFKFDEIKVWIEIWPKDVSQSFELTEENKKDISDMCKSMCDHFGAIKI